MKLVSGHAASVSQLVFSSVGDHLASCSSDGALAVWAMKSLEQIVVFQTQRQACTCAAFDPSIRPQLSSDDVVNGSSKQQTAPPAANEQGRPPRSAPPLHVVAGYSDGTMRVFDVGGVRMVRKMQPHGSSVRAVSYSADGACVTRLPARPSFSCQTRV